MNIFSLFKNNVIVVFSAATGYGLNYVLYCELKEGSKGGSGFTHLWAFRVQIHFQFLRGHEVLANTDTIRCFLKNCCLKK